MKEKPPVGWRLADDPSPMFTISAHTIVDWERQVATLQIALERILDAPYNRKKFGGGQAHIEALRNALEALDYGEDYD